MHEPLSLEIPSAKKLVIFIHGFMGSPRQFDSLAEAAHDCGCSVAALLLPGHGTTVADFSRSTADAWMDHVFSQIERFAGAYEKIYLVGHSMGGLLALNAAARFGGRICGLLLVACPIKLRALTLRTAKACLRQIFPLPENPPQEEFLSGSSVASSASLLWRSVRPVRELKRLIALTVDCLPKVCAPVTAIYSQADGIVAPDGADTLAAGLTGLPPRRIILTESRHLFYPESERAIIVNAMLEMLENSRPELSPEKTDTNCG